MTKLQNFFVAHKKGLSLLGTLCAGVILFEFFGFNHAFLSSRVSNLQERRYSARDGSLYQFDSVKRKLVAQTNDPNITFNNINLPVASVTINCVNTMPGAVGQVFYSRQGEAFSETKSVQYNPASPDKTLLLSQILGFPRTMTVASLRFDLTNIPGDSISCSEIVINPRIPFEWNSVRLAIYGGLLWLALLYFFRNIKPDIYPNVVFISIFLALVFMLGIKLIPFATSQNVIFIVVLCILLFSAAATYALAYLYIGAEAFQSEKRGIVERYKYELAIAVVLLITALPLLTESFFYYDDWWGIGNKALLTRQNIITFARPIQILIYAVFDNISIRNAYVFKWIFLPAIVLYAIVLYRWLYLKTEDNTFSFILACILSVFAPAMDLLGYSATSAFCYSILFAALAVIFYERAYQSDWQKEKLTFLVNLIFAFLFLFVALLTYQIGAQIVFVFLAIDVYFNVQKKSHLLKNLAFLSLFIISNGFYLLFIKYLNWAYLVEITGNRSEIIRSLPQAVEKISFYKSVVWQSMMQVVAALTGGSFILERYRGYLITFSNYYAGNLLLLFVGAMIFIAFTSYWLRTRNSIGLLSLLAFMPMSYFVFLVLAESSYLTYYAFAHISLIMFYFIVGLIASIQFVWRKIIHRNEEIISIRVIKPAYIIAPLLVACALISNYYVRDFYINYNRTVYDFVKYSLQTTLGSGDIKRIHIIGSISPINADVYSRFVAETAIKDLGRNVTDYTITFSKNRFFLVQIESADYIKIRKRITEADRQELDKLYTFTPTYRQYSIKSWPSEADQRELQRIFILAGMIPPSASPHTLTIDLSWTAKEYYNHQK